MRRRRVPGEGPIVTLRPADAADGPGRRRSRPARPRPPGHRRWPRPAGGRPRLRPARAALDLNRTSACRVARMRAAVFDRYGPPEVLRVAELPDPVPGPGQARVRVRAAGVQPFDVGVREGWMRRGPG